MSKIAIVGDVHIGTQVSTRTDNYFETCLSKLRQVFQKNDIIIFGGDLFHTPTIPWDKFYELALLFREFNSVKKYCIVGNHDIFNLNMSTLPKTSLGLLELMGLITILKPEEPLRLDNNLVFESTDVDFSKIKGSDNRSLFLFHHFYNLSCSDSLNEEMLDKLFPNRLGCFCFHDHQPYETINNVYRPGSLLRNANTDYNRNRKPFYYQIDTETKQIIPIEIICKNGNEIFVDNLIIKKREKFLENLENTIAKCSEKIDTNKKYSMLEALSEVKTPKKCFDYIVATCKTMNVSIK